MPRPLGVAERAMDAQVGIRELRKRTAPLFEAAVATGDWTLMAETKALAETLRVGLKQARRIAGLAEAIACPDGVAGAGHGRAA